MDDKRIAEIRSVVERARARVPFKGRAYVGGDHICGDDGEDELYWYDLRMGESEWSFSEPALPELFAVAWNDLPDLLAALDAARADVARLREQVDTLKRRVWTLRPALTLARKRLSDVAAQYERTHEHAEIMRVVNMADQALSETVGPSDHAEVQP